MTVYVDNVRIAYKRMKMCHMIADSLPELHAMAEQLGLRRWFQWRPTSCPHYDIALSKRAEAVALGAVLLERREFVKVLRHVRPTLQAEAAQQQTPPTSY